MPKPPNPPIALWSADGRNSSSTAEAHRSGRAASITSPCTIFPVSRLPSDDGCTRGRERDGPCAHGRLAAVRSKDTTAHVRRIAGIPPGCARARCLLSRAPVGALSRRGISLPNNRERNDQGQVAGSEWADGVAPASRRAMDLLPVRSSPALDHFTGDPATRCHLDAMSLGPGSHFGSIVALRLSTRSSTRSSAATSPGRRATSS